MNHIIWSLILSLLVNWRSKRNNGEQTDVTARVSSLIQQKNGNGDENDDNDFINHFFFYLETDEIFITI